MFCPFSIIAAVDRNLGIGKDGHLPWQLKADLRYFREITTAVTDPLKMNAVVMGRRTWESLPEKFRPLPRRLNVVISSNPNLALPPGVVRASNFAETLQIISRDHLSQIEKIFIIGGAQLYEQGIHHDSCQMVFLTRIDAVFNCDVFFPKEISRFRNVDKSPVAKEGEYVFWFERYVP